MRHDEKEIVSISSLIEKLDAHRKDKEILWFRGQSNREWKLAPSISRDCAQPVQKEWALFKRFKQNATRFLGDQTSRTNWEWFFLMQHHAVPTRLLDWSENPLVALYFCIANSERDDKDASLWVLSPIKYNEHAGFPSNYKNDIPCFDLDKELDAYHTEKVLSGASQNPIACIAPKNSSRMVAQHGVFTIFHSDFKPLEEVAESASIWKYKIPSTSKKHIRKELNLLSYNKLSIFPEIGNVASYLEELF